MRWQLTEGREDVPRVWRDLETKMRRNCSHVPHPVPHPTEPCDLLSSEARPCKFVLLYSVARKRFDRTFHSKCPCFRPYNRTCGPDKSAMRIPNLQAITTQSPKDFISGEITSCSVQLLLRIVNVQATHMYPLVHAP